jgi:hypothetical protein
MTHEQEQSLLDATVAVSRVVLQLSRARQTHTFTDRHRRLLAQTAENFDGASRLLLAAES